jgi:MATE family multidrug resistance protein
MSTFLKLGVPTGASSVIDWASGAIAGSFAGLCGVEVAAGQNVLNSLFSLTYSTVSGFSTATQIRLARYLGEGKPQAAKRILRIGSATLLSGGVIICVFMSAFSSLVWGIWTKDQKLIQLCNTAIVAFMAGVMLAYLRFTLTVVCVSLGPREAWINLVSNNIASWLIYIPLAYVMPLMWGWGLSGFWWSDACGEAFKVACLSWAVARVDWGQASRDARARQANGRQPASPSPTMNKLSLSPLLMSPGPRLVEDAPSPTLVQPAPEASSASPAAFAVAPESEAVRGKGASVRSWFTRGRESPAEEKGTAAV